MIYVENAIGALIGEKGFQCCIKNMYKKEKLWIKS